MRRYTLFLALIGLALATPVPAAAQKAPASEVSQQDVDEAARSIARYCKILVERMDGLINEEWATQDLGALASVWDALNCHQVFGFDPGGDGSGGRKLRWIVR